MRPEVKAVFRGRKGESGHPFIRPLYRNFFTMQKQVESTGNVLQTLSKTLTIHAIEAYNSKKSGKQTYLKGFFLEEQSMTGVKKLGEMLKESGLIDDFQLESALSHQRNWGGKLGTILVELEFAREEEIARVISEKLRIPYVNLFEPDIPESVINLVKVDVAKKYHAVPVKKEKTTLILAMSDPLDIEAIDALRFVTNLNIKPALVMESEIQNAIKKYYEGADIVRKSPEAPLYHQAHTTGGKMELIHGSDLSMPKQPQSDESSPILSKDETLLQELRDNKIRVDALITLLIEKEFITRDELVNMIYQKKLGL